MEKGRIKDMEIANLRQEVTQMRELVTISMLSQSSAIDRLQGVSMSREVGNPDDRLLDALIRTMETDPNVNVRLAAVDALGKYGDREWIRKALVISLKSQSSPLVQVSLIDLLVDLREPRAKGILTSLAADENSPEPVRKRARAGLEKMI
jgi:HEAT repeat protein